MSRMLSAVKTLAGVFGRRPGSTRVPKVKIGMDRARQFLPEWQAELDAYIPPSDRSSSLYGVWDAGDWWEPVHRFTILQLVPWDLADVEERKALSGPSPRHGAELVRVPTRQGGQLVWTYELQGPYNIGITDRLCYETHRKLRAEGRWVVPRRFWVVQGSEGGYPAALTQREQRLWRLQRKPFAWAGEAPFVAFDRRVLDAIQEYDCWSYVHGRRTAYAGAAGHINRARLLDMEANRLQWDATHALNEEAADKMGFLMRQAGMHNLRLNPVGFKPEELDVDTIKHAFLTNTHQEAAY